MRSPTSNMKCRKAGLGVTLDACSSFLLADITGLHKLCYLALAASGRLGRDGLLTSFHLDFGIVSTPSMGSI